MALLLLALQKLGVDDEFSAILASGVSICGVSAAIATSGAIKGDPKKLSYITSLVLVTAVPMMVLMPVISKWCPQCRTPWPGHGSAERWTRAGRVVAAGAADQ